MNIDETRLLNIDYLNYYQYLGIKKNDNECNKPEVFFLLKQMIKQRFSILLILLMVITPVVSAFDHCSGMAMPDHLSEGLDLVTVVATVDHLLSSKHQKHGEKSHQKNSAMYCHASGSCTFHVCGSGCGITSSSLTSNLIASYIFLQFESSTPYSPSFSPEIRPPIFIL